MIAVSASCQVWLAGFLGFPIQKNNFPGSREFSAIRVRRKISYFLGWTVEWISPRINEYHNSLLKCKTSTSVVPPLTWDLKTFLGKAKSPTAHAFLLGKEWHRADGKHSHISWWAPGRWSCIVVRSPTQKHANISSQGLPAQHHPSFRWGDSASVTGCLLLTASAFVALNLLKFFVWLLHFTFFNNFKQSCLLFLDLQLRKGVFEEENANLLGKLLFNNKTN